MVASEDSLAPAAARPGTALGALAREREPRIAVVRALQLGDMLCAVPALRALRRAVPHARITLIGLPWAEAFVRRYPGYLDELFPLPGFPGLPEQAFDVERLPAFLTAAREAGFHLAVQMHGNGAITNPLTALLGARRHAGFVAPGGWHPEPELAFPYPERESEVWRLLRLVHALGAPAGSPDLEFPVLASDRARAQRLAAGAGIELEPQGYVCVHPGASAPERCWPASRFASAARALRRRGLSIVITGTPHEQPLAARVAALIGRPVVDLAGRTDLGALAALLERSALLLCNDTGVSHLAAALRVPSVVCFHPPDVNGWAPLDRRLHRVLYRPFGLDVDAVVEAAQELLGREKVAP